MSNSRKFNLGRNSYERPTEPWICGRLSEGLPCARGPGPNGECGLLCQPEKDQQTGRFLCRNASMLSGQCDTGPLPDGSCSQTPALCQPARQQGRFVCTRGQCAAGPLPNGECGQRDLACLPVRSLMHRRRLMTLAALGLALGAGLLMLGGPFRQQIVSPGPLTSHHSVTRGGCSDCHLHGDDDLVGWTGAALRGEKPLAQSKKCLKCHDQLLGASAMFTHGIAPQELSQSTAKAEELDWPHSEPSMMRLARVLPGKPQLAGGEVACAVCHQEHHGHNFDLQAMSNQQCQSCHTHIFESFVDGHPPLTAYPFGRRTRIHFNHDTHLNGHFANFWRLMPQGKARTCRDCHPITASGSMTVGSFETMCADCHDRQITDDIPAPLAFLALPGVDVGSLRKEGVDQPKLDRWRADSLASGKPAPIEPPPLMRILLSADHEYQQFEKDLAGVSLWNLEKATGEQKQAATGLMEGIQGLMQELAHRDAKVRIRLTKAFGSRAAPSDIERLESLLSHEVFSAAQQDWFSSQPAAAEQQQAASPAPPGWSHSKDFEIRYRARRHADPFLREWLDVACAIYDRSLRAADPDASASKEDVADWYRQLVQPFAAGRCVKCHTVDGPRVNWRARLDDPSARPFTRFTHTPHVILLTDAQCRDCHKRRPGLERYPPQFFQPDGTVQTEPHSLAGEFQRLTLDDCAHCHKPGKAPDTCLSCHNYHVRWPSASLGTTPQLTTP